MSNINLRSVDKGRAKLELLGCDFSNWADVKCIVQAGKGNVLVNDEPAFEFDLKLPAKKIVGMNFRFQGNGSVDYVRLSKADGSIAFEDNF